MFKFYRNNLSQTYSAKMVDPYTMNLMKSKEPIELRKAVCLIFQARFIIAEVCYKKNKYFIMKSVLIRRTN